ncbi:Fe2+-dependent dioxygenase [Comamonas sp. B-9]|uniref:Fe2+-dependent dioxygenase n=1 Tax=Comamonas sp. B-9 TaxID=1055192 RepID=UPI00039565E9|nr:Fe2+-dependent dioxygenase [Comamonas sp. B-9]
MLLRIPALLTPKDVEQCRATLAQIDWQDGKATAGHLAMKVKDNQQLPLDSQAGMQMGNLILDRLGHNPLFLAAALPAKVLPPRFNRYAAGGTYGNHIDNALFNMPGSAIRVRSDVSTTVFFSDPDEYDGGELVIEDLYGEQTVKLAAGDAIVYPGDSMHRVNPVMRGVRLASFFWTQSLVRSDAQRRLLFDLDQSIQMLERDHPSHPRIAALSGTYHNLLRMWSEV